MKEHKYESKNNKSYKYLETVEQFSDMSNSNNKKRTRSFSNEVNQSALKTTGNQECEIWLHEQCITWSAGVYITGGRINGLQDAVLDANKSFCNFCGLSGANIGCIKRGCKSIVHFCCALTTGWLLDTDQYIPKCNVHKL
ncbi:uncharacterized protein CG5098-like [Copidosoma floridanum]|uniref:uncharacterized protein CG5098-like n=1 Tax=Copidosoma floridanum TaxID=29053 RepID=UPI0006C9DEEA|nr:uncharacterized protein CG5098-like [Copidosoma floridanum]